MDLSGTGVALVTPFREDKSIDFQSLERFIDYQLSGGVEYLVVMGTTGESATLSKDEKAAVLSFVKDKVQGKIPIVYGIGGNNTHAVVSSIRETDLDGVSAILSVCPYYNKPNQEGIYLHYKTIASASPLPIVMYNVPGRTGIQMSAETTVKLANEADNIIATKEASGDFAQIMSILKNKPKDFQVISGDDAITYPMLALGAIGVISVVANGYPKEFSDMVRALLKGDLQTAKSIHYKLLDIISVIFKEGSPAGIKVILEVKGIMKNQLRLPLTPVSKPLYDQIKKLMI